jgi:hypothetical protein
MLGYYLSTHPRKLLFYLRHTERFRQVQLLKSKERQKEEAMHIEDTQRLVTEIEMLKVVLYLVVRKERSS